MPDCEDVCPDDLCPRLHLSSRSICLGPENIPCLAGAEHWPYLAGILLSREQHCQMSELWNDGCRPVLRPARTYSHPHHDARACPHMFPGYQVDSSPGRMVPLFPNWVDRHSSRNSRNTTIVVPSSFSPSSESRVIIHLLNRRLVRNLPVPSDADRVLEQCVFEVMECGMGEACP